MEWLYEVHDEHDIAVLNLSLGGDAHKGACDGVDGSKPILDAVDNLRNVGVVTVAAAGNGSNTDRIAWPACLSNVISVGATTNTDAFASFTDVSAVTDVMAPGVDIRSSVVGGGYGTFSGTSMAAPHVAGTVALLKQARPASDWKAIRSALRTSRAIVADDRTNGVECALPRLDVPAAVGAVAGSDKGCGTQYVPLTPSRVLDTRVGTGSVKKPLGIVSHAR
jgi:serine protease